MSSWYKDLAIELEQQDAEEAASRYWEFYEELLAYLDMKEHEERRLTMHNADVPTGYSQ